MGGQCYSNRIEWRSKTAYFKSHLPWNNNSQYHYLSQAYLSTRNRVLLLKELETLLEINYQITKSELNIVNFYCHIYLGKIKTSV